MPENEQGTDLPILSGLFPSLNELRNILMNADAAGMQIDTDNDGQIIIYTGLMYPPDQSSGTYLDVVEFTSGDEEPFDMLDTEAGRQIIEYARIFGAQTANPNLEDQS